MYSVNIDKLMDIDSEKKESLVQIAHNITEALSSGKSVAVIGGKVDTFRIAYSIMEAGNKVLFVDGDITSDVFLGKYKLGKNARGVMDYLKNPDEDYELVCVTNHKELDIIFTGITEDGIVTQEEKEAFRKLLDKYNQNYDYIVVDSDDTGILAEYCAGTVISGKFILKVAGTLTAISLVVAALLGLVDNVTADKIAAIDAENTRIAMSAVVPEGSEFTDKLDIPEAVAAAASAQGGTLSELYGVTNGGAEAGYVAKVAASGSQGTITMMVGIDANGAITGISVVSHSETSGIGTKVVENKPNAAGTPVLDQFVGMSGAGTLAVGSNITAISGATVSTKGITMGANAALAAVEALG